MAGPARLPLPSGRLSPAQDLVFATTATAAGPAILWLGIGRTAGILGLNAAVFYNGVYTPWLKPTSPFAAVPGAIPRSIPPVIGWSAAGGRLPHARALLLFGLLFLLQMPPFLALAPRHRPHHPPGRLPHVPQGG